MFVDSHCHLTDGNLISRLDSVLLDMAKAGVDRALTIGTTLPDSQCNLQLVQPYANLWCSVGVHPEESGEPQPTIDELVHLAANKKVVAIGETGLDYFHFPDQSREQLQWQHDRFETHIEAARRADLPLIIHSREAAEGSLAILSAAVQKTNTLRGVFHCFSENADVAKRVLDLGFYISLSGILTFKSAGMLRDVAKQLPRERVLIETDSPYLAPVPYRGKINTPAYVPYVAAELAKIWHTDIEEVAHVTSQNFDNLFTRVKNETT